MNCQHSLIEPNGDCIFCGRLATGFPGQNPHHVMVPRGLVDKVKADLVGGATTEEFINVLQRWEGAVSEVEREGNDGAEELKELTESRAALMDLLRRARVKLEGR